MSRWLESIFVVRDLLLVSGEHSCVEVAHFLVAIRQEDPGWRRHEGYGEVQQLRLRGGFSKKRQ